METYLRPKDLNSAYIGKVLAFLNEAETAMEIVDVTVIFNGKGILSIRAAKKILDMRAKLGGFENLKQLAIIPGIGEKRLAAIVQAISRIPMPQF